MKGDAPRSVLPAGRDAAARDEGPRHRPMISVRVFHDGVLAREQVLGGAPVTIGRGPECEVVLFDATVSRAHARVEVDARGRLVLRDLASRNGVRVGAARVAEVVGTPSIRCWVGSVLVEVHALSADVTQEIRAEDVQDLEQRRTVADHVKYVAARHRGLDRRPGPERRLLVAVAAEPGGDACCRTRWGRPSASRSWPSCCSAC